MEITGEKKVKIQEMRCVLFVPRFKGYLTFFIRQMADTSIKAVWAGTGGVPVLIVTGSTIEARSRHTRI